MVFRVLKIVVIWLAFLLLASSGVDADIFRYKDKNGVWHFTNIKDDHRYKLYIKTRRIKSADYIKEYEGIIGQASRQFGVESSLIKAIIKAESDFDHRAVSKKGAQGLMQLMPKTAEQMNVDDPFDPEENIFGGTRYFSELLVRFDNDVESAVAAYNAGPEMVKSHKGIPPIPETQNFVKKVMKYYKKFNSSTK